MFKQRLTALALALGASLAFSSASCGPTCPAGQQSCGTANASPNTAGAAGSSDACELLTTLHKCMAAFCATTTNPFCTCYKRRDETGSPFDIDTASCKCVEIDAQAYCDATKGIDPASYDCPAESSRVSSICVPVN